MQVQAKLSLSFHTLTDYIPQCEVCLRHVGELILVADAQICQDVPICQLTASVLVIYETLTNIPALDDVTVAKRH